IGFAIHSTGLAAGDSYMAHLDVAVPPGLSGPYYVFVRTDWFNQVAETDEFNNVGGPAAVALTLPPPVDLVVTHVEPLPAGSPGDTVTFQWTVLNQRTNTAGG